MSAAQRRAREREVQDLWLTAWVGNDRAKAFYRSLGFRDVGITQYIIEGKAYENRVFAKRAHEGTA